MCKLLWMEQCNSDIMVVSRAKKFSCDKVKLFDGVKKIGMLNKKPTRCHLVLYLFLLISCSTRFGPPCAHLQTPLSHQLLKMGTRWPETCWATYKEQLIRRNKYNTKWHLVGFSFHLILRIICASSWFFFTRLAYIRDAQSTNHKKKISDLFLLNS